MFERERDVALIGRQINSAIIKKNKLLVGR